MVFGTLNGNRDFLDTRCDWLVIQKRKLEASSWHTPIHPNHPDHHTVRVVRQSGTVHIHQTITGPSRKRASLACPLRISTESVIRTRCESRAGSEMQISHGCRKCD